MRKDWFAFVIIQVTNWAFASQNLPTRPITVDQRLGTTAALTFIALGVWHWRFQKLGLDELVVNFRRSDWLLVSWK